MTAHNQQVEKTMIKLEDGKYYKTRDGRKVGPMEKFDRYFKCPQENEFYYSDGVMYRAAPTDDDIISEWAEENSPVREVTRRELVAGKYGIVYVDGGAVCIGANNYSSNELREAAHTLNQIAEYLESEGK